MMLFNANINSNKINILLKEYEKLLKNGISENNILFLVQNPYKKKYIINILEKKNINCESINTFQGLVYKTINKNWDFLSSKIKIGDKKEIPNLCSMELSQFIMQRCIKEIGFKDYFSKINLLHQLFRRYYLILQNDLTENEVLNRSELIGETWATEAQNVLKKYEEKTLKYKSFDYLRQLSLFKYIYKNTNFFSNIEYLLLDDADEITEYEFNFIKSISKNLKDYFIIYDSCGSSRTGYLSAKKNIEQGLLTIFKTTPKTLEKNDFIDKRSKIIYNNFVKNKKEKIEKFSFENYISRLQMIAGISEKINLLLKNGTQYSEIAIITPDLDFSFENFLQKYLPENSYEIVSGNKKLSQNFYIQNVLTILKLANPDWKMDVKTNEINSILNNFLKIPIKECQSIFTEFKRIKKLSFFEFNNKKYENNYKKLLDIISKISLMSLSEALILLQKEYQFLDNNNINFLMKKIKEFEYLFADKIYDKKMQKNIILQFENSMISENSTEENINTKKIIISTPQKFIDIEHKVKYQFWLDLTNSKWMVEDVGNIYNAWIFQPNWNKKNFEYQDLYNLTKDKTGRMLRKIALLCSDKIFGVSSCYNSTGYENISGILEFLHIKNNEITKKQFIPRDDQKEVLQYENGQFAIAAVPGAGKTTVLLGLIMELLEKNINAENIYVLTYMDSAAKHFKEKLLEFLPDLKILPNISTIHGLCLKFLKDNSNYLKLGLAPDFQICGEMDRKTIIYSVLNKLNLSEEYYDRYEKAVSMAKLNSEINTEKNKNQKFQQFFSEYNKLLQENSLIDYDDMLFYAVKLLKNNPDILKIYQNQCLFLIEDEAQDSSIIQQELLNLLSAKNKNLIRCGDPNQAITTTFTNADTKGFIKFIEENKNTKMNSSQRCSKPIFSFANKLIQKYTDSFFQNIMKGTEFNPKNFSKVELLEFEQDSEEKNFILNEIKKIYMKNENPSIAILLRNNYQVENYSEFLNSNEIKTVEKIDSLKNNKIFKLILTFLEMLEYPYNNKILSDGLQKLSELKIYSTKFEEIEELKKSNIPFINCNPDDFKSHVLNKFWWDFNYIFSKSNLDIDMLIYLISDYYFDDKTDIENSCMISQIIKSIKDNIKNETTFIERLKTVANLSNFGQIKLLKDFDEKKQTGVQIMTIHKAKGDEFDYVFVPEMSSKQFNLKVSDIKISLDQKFCENLKQNNKIKSDNELKKEQVDETLRLIYVAITRAKEKLFMSYSKNIKKGAKNLKPCEIFDMK